MADGLYDAMKNSAVGRAFTSYDAESRDAERSLVATKVNSFTSRLNLKRMKLFFAGIAEESVICSAVKSFVSMLLTALLKRYGVFFFTFGAYGAAVRILADYKRFSLSDLTAPEFILFAVMAAASLPMIFSHRRLSEALARGRASNFILFDLLGLRKETLEELPPHDGRFVPAFLFGTVCGVASYWVSPFSILLILAVPIASYTVLTTPESGLVALVVALPFAPPSYLGYVTIYVTFCFVLKLLRGKRTLLLDLKDYAVLLLAFQLLLAGGVSINPGRSFPFAVKMAFYVITYILVVNMIRSDKWLRCMRFAVVTAYAAVVAVGLAQMLSMSVPYLVGYTGAVSDSLTSVFSSPEVFATYISMTVFFVLAEFIGNGRFVRKLFILLLLIGGLVCLWKTGFPPALLACAAAAILFFMVYSNKSLFVFLALLVGVPVSGMVLPGNTLPVALRFTNAFSQYLAAHSAQWRASASMAGDYFWGGAGMGTFVALFPSYVNENIAYAANSGNIYLQLIIEIGFFGLLLFGIVVLLFAQHNFSLYASRGGGNGALVSIAGFSGVIAALIIGGFSYAWSDERMFLMFWIVMGISTAAGNLRVANGRRYYNS